MSTPELRDRCAAQLLAGASRAGQMTAFIGLDGFVDEILHVVDKRDSGVKYSRLATIGGLADRLAAAAGRSTNVELVCQMTKLGGNGPIMANALASSKSPTSACWATPMYIRSSLILPAALKSIRSPNRATRTPWSLRMAKSCSASMSP